MKVDVAVIGAGPAGAMTAMRLAGTGLKTAVLEKQRMPRSKPCGGAVPMAAIEGLRQWVSPAAADKAHKIRFCDNSGRPGVEATLARPLFLADRKRFDQQLIEAAVKCGGGDVTLRDGWPVKGLEETGSCVWIYGSRGEKIEAGFAVGADGAASPTARFLGLRRRSASGFAIDATVQVTARTLALFHATVQFHLWTVAGGYGWIFPKGDRLSCGIGSWRKPFPGRREMDGFLKRWLPAGSIRAVRMRGHPVPLWPGFGRIATRRACLVGDAAHLVHPLTGEGIRFALQSGRLAAETILSLTDRPGGETATAPSIEAAAAGCETVQERIHRTIGRQFDMLKNLALPVFLDAPDLFYRKFVLEGCDLEAVYQNLTDKMQTGRAAALASRSRGSGGS